MEITIEIITELEDEEDPNSNFKPTPCFFFVAYDNKSQKNGKRKLEKMRGNDLY